MAGITVDKTQRRIGTLVLVIFVLGLLIRHQAMPVLEESDIIPESYEKDGTFYQEAGPLANTRQDILFLHGSQYTSSAWLELNTLEILAERSYHVIAVDMPGSGNSASAGSQLTYLRDLIDNLELKNPVVVAPSESLTHVLALAMSRPELLGGLVAVSPLNAHMYTVAQFEDLSDFPTLIIYGDKDPAGKANAELLEKIPGSTTSVIEGGTESAYLDKYDVFHRALVGFLDQLKPTWFGGLMYPGLPEVEDELHKEDEGEKDTEGEDTQEVGESDYLMSDEIA